MLAIARGSSVIASMPPTQRAFRSPAGARVTFLLLAQKKSNPKKTASRAGSTPWDRSAGRFARANSWLPTARHSGYTATRRGAEGLRRGRFVGHPGTRLPKTLRPSAEPALSPHRFGALRCSRCVSPWAATCLSGHALQACIPRNAMSSKAIFFGLLFFWASKRKVTRLPAGSRNARCVSGMLATQLSCRARASPLIPTLFPPKNTFR